jgi:hypothetical protein
MLNMSNSGGSGGLASMQFNASNQGGLTPNGAGSETIIPAYVWGLIEIPSNALSMSFNYKIEGEWLSDSLAVALDGTNVLLIEGNTIQTNVVFSSGPIDVSAFAGQTNELFIGIVGGTSTNAQLTVENLTFSSPMPPLLQAQATRNGSVLTWPLSAAGFSVQTTTNIADPNSWVTLTNVPSVVDLQSSFAITNNGISQFYRLKE